MIDWRPVPLGDGRAFFFFFLFFLVFFLFCFFRSRSSLAALEQQVVVSRETIFDKDDEMRRLKALARQLEGSR